MATESVKEPRKRRKTAEKATSVEEVKKQRDFEMVLVINPDVDAGKFESILDNIKALITGLGGEVSEVEPWGKRKLAYSINGLTEGSYVLAQFKMEPSKNKDLEAKLRISEDVVRHLLIKVGG